MCDGCGGAAGTQAAHMLVAAGVWMRLHARQAASGVVLKVKDLGVVHVVVLPPSSWLSNQLRGS